MSTSQVHGIVQDKSGKTVATMFGKWDESMHFVTGDCSGKGKLSEAMTGAQLLWKRSKPPGNATKYNLTRFAITLNELTPELKVKRREFCLLFFINCFLGRHSDLKDKLM